MSRVFVNIYTQKNRALLFSHHRSLRSKTLQYLTPQSHVLVDFLFTTLSDSSWNKICEFTVPLSLIGEPFTKFIFLTFWSRAQVASNYENLRLNISFHCPLNVTSLYWYALNFFYFFAWFKFIILFYFKGRWNGDNTIPQTQSA